MLAPLLSSPVLGLQTFPCSPLDNTNCRCLYFLLYYSDCVMVLLGDGVGTVEPVADLLLAQVHSVGVEVESGHISLSSQCPPPQVGPIVGGEGLQVLIKLNAGWSEDN